VGRVNKSGARTDARSKASPTKKKVSNAKVADRAPSSIVRLAARNGNGRKARNGRTLLRRLKAKPAPERKVIRILDLDPLEKCGRGTSVQRLIRVDEMIDQAREAHLVFLDRHGWYCEHGKSCPAVDDVRKVAGSHSTAN
jgi:hypothetical protein